MAGWLLNFWLCQEIRIFTPRTNPQAALSLRESYMLKAPSAKLSGKDKAAVVAKELGDFLGHYKRETELFTVFREESGMIPRHIFEEFVAFASDSGNHINCVLLILLKRLFYWSSIIIPSDKNDLLINICRFGGRIDAADEAVQMRSYLPWKMSSTGHFAQKPPSQVLVCCTIPLFVKCFFYMTRSSKALF